MERWKTIVICPLYFREAFNLVNYLAFTINSNKLPIQIIRAGDLPALSAKHKWQQV
jgi:hypothetical protein